METRDKMHKVHSSKNDINNSVFKIIKVAFNIFCLVKSLRVLKGATSNFVSAIARYTVYNSDSKFQK